MPTSKETRVRVDGFWKIIPRLRPGRRRCSSPACCFAFSSSARSSTPRSSSPLQSATRVNDRPFTRPRSYWQGLDTQALRFYSGVVVKSLKGGEMATLVRWEPFREVAALQTEMSRFMNGLLEGNGRTNQAWVPALDVWETEAEIVYALDLPGIPEDKISVEFEDGALTVTAQRERKEELSEDQLYRFERRFATYSRTFGLPQGVTEDQINADYKNGVL